MVSGSKTVIAAGLTDKLIGVLIFVGAYSNKEEVENQFKY
jgi:hypothetical protein